MKQSTKLLSLVLALLIAFSCMSVIGSAALVKSEVTYDVIDDADLSYEQVADIALDLVDDLLKDADIGEVVNLLGLRIDLSNVNETFSSLWSTSNAFLFSIAKGLLGDIGDLNFDALANDTDGNGVDSDDPAWQRENGDYNVISALLQFLADNAGTLSKAAYGIGTDGGISLGSILGGLLDLGSIQDLLADIPGFLVSTVFDLLVYGSYGYDMDSEDIKEAKKTLTDVYPEMDTLDEMVPNVIYNLLTKPQDYEYIDDVKTWDMTSVIMPNLADKGITAESINPLSKSLFQILDTAAQVAIDEIGVPALNNNLKKALMKAVEADLNEIDGAALPDDVKTAFEYSKDATGEQKSFVTYFAYDKMAKSGGTWYYTTYETEPLYDETTGEVVVDPETNEELSHKVPKYFKVNMGAANEFASLINWDWEFVGSDAVAGEGQTALIYDDFKAINGTFVGGLNNLLGMVYEVALSDAAKADFVASINEYVDDSYTGWFTDPSDEYDNTNINLNIEYLLKYILTEFGDKVFGESSEYASYTMETVAEMTIIDIVAMIGPGFFEDAMPQIILPKNTDGSYAFHEGVQLWEFAAIVLRELMTGIAPIVNYDAVIFANGDVTSANDRQIAEHDADEWFNIILNMGTDLGLVYLQQLTNFQDYLDVLYDGTVKVDDWINDMDGATQSSHWGINLNSAILWALDYIGGADHNTGVLNGITYNSVSAITNDDPGVEAFTRLSFILNSILPLGFIGDGTYTSGEYALDLNLVADGLKLLLTDFDLTALLSLFGRNDAAYNMFKDASVGTMALDLVNRILNLVFGDTILQGVNTVGTPSAQSLYNGNAEGTSPISKASLKTTINKIITGLNNRKHDILKNGAPVLAKFIKDWGGEQEFNRPTNDMGTHIVLPSNNAYELVTNNPTTDCDGAVTANGSYSYNITASHTINVFNESKGVWRHYRDAAGNEYKDEQYKIQLVDVQAFDIDGTESDYINNITWSTGIADFGGSTNFTFSWGGVTAGTAENMDNAGTKWGGSAIPAEGVVAKFKIGYVVYIEDGSKLAGGATFYDEQYVYLGLTESDEGVTEGYEVEAGVGGLNGKNRMEITKMYYVPFSTASDYVNNITPVNYMSETGTLGGYPTQELKFDITSGGTQYGFTPSSAAGVTTKDGTAHGAIGLYIFRTYTADWNGLAINLTGSVPTQEAFEETVYAEKPLYDTVSTVGNSINWGIRGSVKGETFDTTITFRFYDDVYRDKLVDLLSREDSEMRVAEDYKHYYNANATVVLNEALENELTTDDNGNEILPETNFGVNADGYTEINCKQAWDEYYAALIAALPVGLQGFNPSMKYNFKEVYDRLQVAVNDIERCRATAEDGAATLVGDIDNLESALRASMARTVDQFNHTDYKMYRHNKYNAARDDVNYYINLRKDAQPSSVEEIDQYFDYNWMEENDFLSLIGAHNVKFGDDAGQTVAEHKYYDYLKALLKDFSDEEIAEKATWLNNKKVELAGVNKLDLAMSQNLLEITEERLLRRDSNTTAAIKDQLADEVTSAENMIGIVNGAKGITYTAKSWENYIQAYNKAKAIVDDASFLSQKQTFDAKYDLLIKRKALVDVNNAGDYSELNALIAHAQFALENANLYESNVEGMTIEQILGMVLAELGMDPITSVDGYEVQLFPGSALITVANDYSADDQNKIDDAAWVLKEALARLTFKGLQVKDLVATENAGKDVFVESEVLVPDDEKTEDVIETVKALVSHIEAEQDDDAVKAYFDVVSSAYTNFEVDEVVVTNDVNFAVSFEGAEEFTGFAGTNSTVTFYTTYNGVKLPVATVKIVVDGDINGDGAVDVLDASYGALVASKKGELNGCYLLAGDISNGNGEIEVADYQQIVDKAVGKKTAA